MRDALDQTSRPVEPANQEPQSHVVITAIDCVMGAVALVLAVGLVAAAILQRDIPSVLVMAFGQIVAYYFGRSAKT